MHPFRFGLLVEQFASAEYLVALAQQAEQAGFSTLLIRDHLLDTPFPGQYAPWITLAYLAAATRTLRLGTLVTANDFRHPAILAKEVTTLDQLSAGRAELGLGAGFFREEYDRAGLSFEPNNVRVDRLEESLEVLGALLSGGCVSHVGQHFQFNGFTNFPPPVQRPRPPLLVAGAGPSVLSIAARHADSIGLLPAPLSGGVLVDSAEARAPASLHRQLEILRSAAGDRFDRLELSVVATLEWTVKPLETAADIAQRRGWSVPARDVLDMPTMLVGTTDGLVEKLHARRERFGLSYFVVRDSQLAEATLLLEALARLE
jgi:probable F420-dependent oxidoreductase